MKVIAKSLIAATVLSFGISAHAAEAPSRPNQPSRVVQEQRPRIPAAQGRKENVDPEKQEQLKKANDELMKDQTAIYEKMREARAELDKQIRAEKFDEAAIREKAMALGKLQADLAVVQGRYHQHTRELGLARDQVRDGRTNASARIPTASARVARTNLFQLNTNSTARLPRLQIPQTPTTTPPAP